MRRDTTFFAFLALKSRCTMTETVNRRAFAVIQASQTFLRTGKTPESLFASWKQISKLLNNFRRLKNKTNEVTKRKKIITLITELAFKSRQTLAGTGDTVTMMPSCALTFLFASNAEITLTTALLAKESRITRAAFSTGAVDVITGQTPVASDALLGTVWPVTPCFTNCKQPIQ